GRVTAIVNPTITGSSSNGLDDDDDGQIDEPDEEGKTIPVRNAPAFAPNTALYGSISGDGQFVILHGLAGTLPDLAFAASSADAGLTPLVGGQHEIVVSLVRTGPRMFLGRFRDGFASLDRSFGFFTEGNVLLERVVAPRCVVRDAGANTTIPLDILCRT